ncbi:MAG TPA: dephospho-CoA kinase, partial [Sumerlaeia bacterium]|nr:dephospho-CoA kinase [Sumerlaeia bacterium]
RMFEDLGAAVIDADAIAREAVEAGRPAMERIRKEFGADYVLPSGEMNRKRMAAAVFSSPERRRTLEAIVHPAVREEMERRVRLLRETVSPRHGEAPAAIVLDVPLLFEACMTDMADKVVVVTVNEAARFRRVRMRDGLTEAQIVRRLGSQWSQSYKAARADRVIDNSGSLQASRDQVARFWEECVSASAMTSGVD